MPSATSVLPGAPRGPPTATTLGAGGCGDVAGDGNTAEREAAAHSGSGSSSTTWHPQSSSWCWLKGWWGSLIPMTTAPIRRHAATRPDDNQKVSTPTITACALPSTSARWTEVGWNARFTIRSAPVALALSTSSDSQTGPAVVTTRGIK